MIISLLFLFPSVKADATTINISADCSYDSLDPNTNFNTQGFLASGSSLRYGFYMRFDLTALAGKTINSANISLYCYASGTEGNSILRKVDNTTWLEASLTANNRPVMSDALVTIANGATINTWYNYSSSALTSDVDAYKGGLISFGMNSTSTGYNFYKERNANGGIYKAVLYVDYSDAPTPTPTPSPTPSWSKNLAGVPNVNIGSIAEVPKNRIGAVGGVP